MEVKITIDRGNTALKGAIWDADGNIICAMRGDDSLPAGELARELCAKAGGAVSAPAVAYCSVVASDRADDLASLRSMCGRLIDLDASTPMPMHIRYRTPGTLGADRIAAALGAISLDRKSVV